MRKLKYALILSGIIAAVVGSALTATYTYSLSDRLDNLRRTSRADAVYLRRQIRTLEERLSVSFADALAEALPDAVESGDEEGSLPVIGSEAEEITTETAFPESEPAETESVPNESEPSTDAVVLPESTPDADTAISDTETLTDASTDAASPAETETETESTTETETEIESESETVTETDTEPESEPEAELSTEAVTLPTHESPEPDTTDKPAPEAPAEPDEPDAPTSPEWPTELYIIATSGNRIGVFDADGTLLRTVNVFVFTLPDADREALEVGIAAYSRDEVRKILSRYE